MTSDSDNRSGKKDERQAGESRLALPARPTRPAESPPARPVSAPAPTPERRLRVITGEGQGRDETLRTRDDVARLLVAAAADMMLKRITPERAHEIQLRVDRVMRLFARSKDEPLVMPILRRELDELEEIYRDGGKSRRRR